MFLFLRLNSSFKVVFNQDLLLNVSQWKTTKWYNPVKIPEQTALSVPSLGLTAEANYVGALLSTPLYVRSNVSFWINVSGTVDCGFGWTEYYSVPYVLRSAVRLAVEAALRLLEHT